LPGEGCHAPRPRNLGRFAPAFDPRNVRVRTPVRRLDARQVGEIAVRIPADRIPPLIHRQVAAPACFRPSRLVPLNRRQGGAIACIGARILPIAPFSAVTQFIAAAVRTDDVTAARPDLPMWPLPAVRIGRTAPLGRRQLGTIARVGVRIFPIAPAISFNGGAITDVLPATIGSSREIVA